MPRKSFDAPFYPVIFVRGYAGSQSAVEETVADPYMGFNLGSTKVRQLWDGATRRHYFESPLVRLMKDHHYLDVYENGQELPDSLELSPRSVFIYRYYDHVSDELGPGERQEIESYAAGLGDLILRLQDRYCEQLGYAADTFRVYLVAHSMGGLICRCFLQNDHLVVGSRSREYVAARKVVDKVFTYATPHNGIDLRILGNVPGFFSHNNANNFNRGRIREYLGLPEDRSPENVASLDGRFDPNRFFCLVGTNHRDYNVVSGGVAKVVGPMSDGLVRIGNATVWGPGQGSNGQAVVHQAPRAFVHRSHSGHYGIVNSEEGYQNLTRFLFGDVRIDGWLEIAQLELPPKLERARQDGKKIRASYHFETVVSPRGAVWNLHRRLVSEGSAIFRTYKEMFETGQDETARHPHLFSTFLSTHHKVRKARSSLGFAIDLGVLVPQYEVDGFLMFDEHYEGGYLFRDKINLEVVPPDAARSTWRVRYGFDSKTPNRIPKSGWADPTLGLRETDDSSGIVYRIPIKNSTRPGIDARLALLVRPWNC